MFFCLRQTLVSTPGTSPWDQRSAALKTRLHLNLHLSIPAQPPQLPPCDAAHHCHRLPWTSVCLPISSMSCGWQPVKSTVVFSAWCSSKLTTHTDALLLLMCKPMSRPATHRMKQHLEKSCKNNLVERLVELSSLWLKTGWLHRNRNQAKGNEGKHLGHQEASHVSSRALLLGASLLLTKKQRWQICSNWNCVAWLSWES